MSSSGEITLSSSSSEISISATGLKGLKGNPGTGAATWGGIDGNLPDQTDLQLALDAKSSLGLNDFPVFEPSDLDEFIVGDAWEFSRDINIIIKGNLTFDKAFKNNGFKVHILREGFAGGNLVYTGTDALFQGFGPLLGVTNHDISLTGVGASLFGTDGMAVILWDAIQVIFDPTKGQSLGLIDNVSRAVNFNLVTFITFQFGLRINCTQSVSIANTGFISNTAGASTALSIGRAANIINLNLINFVLGAGESCLFIDPDLVGSADMRSLTNANDFQFYEVGTQGAITAFSDAGIGATAISSVTDSAGAARFNHAGSNVFVGQDVIISAFVTNTAYNGTHRVAVTGAGFFEVEAVVFGSDETGSFLANSSTVTSTAHGLPELQTVLIEDGFLYYGGSTIYNVTANTFEISRLFLGTKTGNWNTGSLDEDDARINATDIGNEADSKSRATIAFHDNTNETNITNGAYGDMNLSGITEPDDDFSRFFISNFTTGEMTYVGRKPFRGSITMQFASANSMVPNGDYKISFSRNGAALDFVNANFMAMSLKNEGDMISLSLALTLQPGDNFKPQIAGDGTSTNLEIAIGIITAI